jgi:hypothetical protein
MAETIWNPSVRATFAERVGKLTVDSKAQWGRMNAAAMLAHLNDSYRMTTGELLVKKKSSSAVLSRTPIKQLIIYVLPFPKGAPTAPELIARCDGADLAAEKLALVKLLDTLGGLTPANTLQPHPAFGALTYQDYGALMAKHTQHHFRQFAI